MKKIKKSYIEIVKSPCGVWYWRVRSSNGVIVAKSCRTFRTHQKAERAWEDFENIIGGWDHKTEVREVGE